jgi:hypothetical protein
MVMLRLDMLCLDPAEVLGFDEEVKGFHHRGHRGSQGKLK